MPNGQRQPDPQFLLEIKSASYCYKKSEAGVKSQESYVYQHPDRLDISPDQSTPLPKLLLLSEK